jgi:hypothetical protein
MRQTRRKRRRKNRFPTWGVNACKRVDGFVYHERLPPETNGIIDDIRVVLKSLGANAAELTRALDRIRPVLADEPSFDTQLTLAIRALYPSRASVAHEPPAPIYLGGVCASLRRRTGALRAHALERERGGRIR